MIVHFVKHKHTVKESENYHSLDLTKSKHYVHSDVRRNSIFTVVKVKLFQAEVDYHEKAWR